MLAEVKEGEWYLIIKPGYFYPDQVFWAGSGNTHSELKNDLADWVGDNICIGPDISYPNYWEENTRTDVIITKKAELVQTDS